VAEETTKRPWWKVKRVQGLIIMAAGAVMACIPVTAPAASTVITIGSVWGGVGVADAAVRKMTKTG